MSVDEGGHASVGGRGEGGGFRHEALFYSDEMDYLQATVSFIHEGLASDQAVLVAVPGRNLDLIRGHLGAQGALVRFADMGDIGRNPARIIPAWREFIDEHSGRASALRGIGEPIWPTRAADEVVEAQQHEALLNFAFADRSDLTILCPYDTQSLDAAVVDEAYHSHPTVLQGGTARQSSEYNHDTVLDHAHFTAVLPEPPTARRFLVAAHTLHVVRRFVADEAARMGLDPALAAQLALAAHEVATNALRHAGEGAQLRMWRGEDRVVCEVRDSGTFDQPLAGRQLPPEDEKGGRGLWMVNRICDLVQIRTYSPGTVIRMHIYV